MQKKKSHKSNKLEINNQVYEVCKNMHIQISELIS